MSLAGIKRFTSPSTPRIPVRGLRGISLAVAGNLSVKVTDFRGRGIGPVRIAVSTGGAFFTDNQGNAFIAVTGTGLKLTLSVGLTSRVFTLPDGVSQITYQLGPTLRY